MNKVCTTCGKTLPLDDFYKDPRTNRPRGRCKTCHTKKSYESRQRRPNHLERQSSENRKQGLKRLLLTPEEYQALHDAQNGLCAICSLPETATSRGRTLMLAVDHDHVTGEVRGLLCMQCNTALGKFKDDPSLLEAASAYLKRCGIPRRDTSL